MGRAPTPGKSLRPCGLQEGSLPHTEGPLCYPRLPGAPGGLPASGTVLRLPRGQHPTAGGRVPLLEGYGYRGSRAGRVPPLPTLMCGPLQRGLASSCDPWPAYCLPVIFWPAWPSVCFNAHSTSAMPPHPCTHLSREYAAWGRGS